MKLNTTANAARSASPIAPMKPLQVKTGVRAGIDAGVPRRVITCGGRCG